MMCAPPRDIADLRTPWIDSPFFEALLARRDLDAETRELVRTYARDGFLTFDPQIPDFDAVAGRIIEALSKRESGRRICCTAAARSRIRRGRATAR